MNEILFLPEAEEEFLEWIARYERKVRGLRGEFIEEVERALERIAMFPEHGSPHLVNTRRVVLQRFPFSVVYEILPEGVLVVAVAHPLFCRLESGFRSSSSAGRFRRLR